MTPEVKRYDLELSQFDNGPTDVRMIENPSGRYVLYGEVESRDRRIAEMEATLKRRTEALIAARDHLDYCGYGDSYEREGAYQSKLPQQIDAALKDPEAPRD